MILSELPRLYRAIELLGLDNGGNPVGDAIIPEAWETRAQIAEDEILQLTETELEDLVYGEEGDQRVIAKRAVAADEFINAAFDGGELAELLMEPWRNIHDARAAERRAQDRPGKERT
jgi:hypothetical protein